MRSVDLFINSYPEDGACDEGPGYWAHATGKMYEYLALLERASGGKVNLFDDELIKNMGRYIYRAYIGNGDNYINYADASLRIHHDPGLIYRYGVHIRDKTMMEFGAYLMETTDFGKRVGRDKLSESLENFFYVEGIEEVKKREPFIPDYYFPDTDLVIARDHEGDGKGFYFSAKGGTNAENHNHNDVGSFMLYFDGQPILIDVGVGSYTRQTFGPDRYGIWTMQSSYHNLPVINGVPQHEGKDYRARNSTFEESGGGVTYATDISGAYPEEAGVRNWIRKYKLQRGRHFLIEDVFDFIENKGNTKIHFMSKVPCRTPDKGVVELMGDGYTLQMKYDHRKLSVAVEDIQLEDDRLRRTLGDEIYRIVFSFLDDSRTGTISFDVTKK